jgi:hypothetical protein
MQANKDFEWIIVGGGVAGISLAEILTREGHSVLLIEQNKKLASQTTREFHEWMHTGSLYTLIPDRLVTLKYILGAVDDLLEYYSSFNNMNLLPTEKGLEISERHGWFNKNFINFKYRIKNRKLTFPWLIGVSRSIFLIEYLKNHDWLRRRAGVIEKFGLKYIKDIFKVCKTLIKSRNKFFTIRTPDFTMNSRKLLRDLLTTSIKHGLQLSLGNKVLSIDKHTDGRTIVETQESLFYSDKVILSCSEQISNFLDVKIKTSYAPIAVVNNVPKASKSFVELDYFTKNCINMITKEDQIGLIGGISVSSMKETKPYIDYVIKTHKKLNPKLKVIGSYVGLKNEIIFKNQDRNYLYHIIKEENANIWSVVPGKFSLVFSLAPEFYRQVYKKNPKKFFKTTEDSGEYSEHIAETAWKDLANE